MLQETIDNNKLLKEKEQLIKKRWDQYLEMWNKYNDLVHERTRESWLLKKEIENMEKDKKELEEKK